MTDTDEIAARLRAMQASMGDWRVPQAHPGINSVEAFALLDERERQAEHIAKQAQGIMTLSADLTDARNNFVRKIWALEASLREAVEVLRAWLKADDIGIGVDIKTAREAARAFLAKMEKPHD